MLTLLLARWKRTVGISLGVGVLALGATFLIPPTYTARTVILPPQQQQSAAAAALSNLGALGALAGGAAGIKSPVDQYVALLQSVTVSNRIIDRYDLITVYESKYRVDAQKTLGTNVRISASKKDGLMTVEVDDHDPQRSAAIANRYIDELRTLTNTLAVTEAQQRRIFFEQQLQKTREQLTRAQVALQTSGFTASALKAEPKAAAETYARLRAELTTGEVRLQALRGTLVDQAPEIVQQQAILTELRRQLSRLEVSSSPAPAEDADYTGRYREFKYQETLFELFARQYELARVDESREGALIQVLDLATVPERKSKPKRGTIALLSTIATGLALCLTAILRHKKSPSK
jgi:uncharacterized protein involved in exopolysaccharide biosynthesis